MEPTAHRTLRLRGFLRKFQSGFPAEYYAFLNGEAPREPNWASLYPRQWQEACDETRCLTLGTSDASSFIRLRIARIRALYGGRTVLLGGCQPIRDTPLQKSPQVLRREPYPRRDRAPGGGSKFSAPIIVNRCGLVNHLRRPFRAWKAISPWLPLDSPWSYRILSRLILHQLWREGNGIRSEFSGLEYGGAEGSRTPDLLNAIQALCRLSYGPIQTRASARPAKDAPSGNDQPIRAIGLQ